MKIEATELNAVYTIELEKFSDERGYFARSFCVDELADAGIEFSVDQTNISANRIAGTVRGMHIQMEPSPETKIVRCVHGRIYDVVIDLRPESISYCHWLGVEVSRENAKAVVIPPGCAHGFQTLEDDSEVHYMMQGRYDPDSAAGVRYNDSVFGIDWPIPVSAVSQKDTSWPDFNPDAGLVAEHKT